MEKGRDVEVVYAYEGCGRARDEDTDLVNCVVGTVKGTVFVEWGGIEGKEQGGCNALVDSVLGNVDEEEG